MSRGVSRSDGFRFSFALVVSLGILLCLSATPVWSQATSSATVTGLVTDQQNAAVPGTEVKLTDVATRAQLTTTTNEAGRYAFVNVQAGTYNMAISKAGFATHRVNSQVVQVGTALTMNATLEVGTTNTTVEVTATMGAELQTEA